MGEDLFVCKCGEPSSDYRGEMCSGCEEWYCSKDCVFDCECGRRCVMCWKQADQCLLCKQILCDECHTEDGCDEVFQDLFVQRLKSEVEKLRLENEELKLLLSRMKST